MIERPNSARVPVALPAAAFMQPRASSPLVTASSPVPGPRDPSKPGWLEVCFPGGKAPVGDSKQMNVRVSAAFVCAGLLNSSPGLKAPVEVL